MQGARQPHPSLRGTVTRWALQSIGEFKGASVHLQPQHRVRGFHKAWPGGTRGISPSSTVPTCPIATHLQPSGAAVSFSSIQGRVSCAPQQTLHPIPWG